MAWEMPPASGCPLCGALGGHHFVPFTDVHHLRDNAFNTPKYIHLGLMNISAAQHFQSSALQDLCRQGWGSMQLEAGNTILLERQLLDIASVLGAPQPTRNKELVDRLIPHKKNQAFPNSLSASTGLDIQPWHIDLAHSQTPVRYIILACEREGSKPVPTELAYWSSLIDIADQEAAHTEPFLVRNGSHSFYATILTRSQQYLRFDPGCMIPVTRDAKILMDKLSGKRIKPALRIKWKLGSAVIIDNWRMLHRRLDAHGTQDRMLLRISVAEEEKNE